MSAFASFASLRTARAARVGVTSLGLAALVVGCSGTESSTADLDPSTSLYALVQTIDGVALYPPLGPEPTADSAPFDATLLSELSVVLESTDGAGVTRTVATFDQATAPTLQRLDTHSVYFVNVPAAAYFTDPSRAYRFRVLHAGAELARSDLSSRVFEVLTKHPELLVGVKLRALQRFAPSLDTLEPTVALVEGGDLALTVRGAAFVHDSIVRLGATPLATTFVSGSQLVATVPAGLLAAPGSAQISVSTPRPGGGVSAEATLAIRNPAPIVDSLAPASLLEGSSGFTLTVRGASFLAGSVVSLAGAPLDTVRISPTELDAIVPAQRVAHAGLFPVVVTTPAPGGGVSAAATFTVTRPVPVLTGIHPGRAIAGDAAFTLTALGASFATEASITFDGNAMDTTFVSDGELRATIPSSAFTRGGTALVTVVNPAPGGGASAPQSFVVDACPAGWHIEGGACTSDTRSCTITNGSGTQSWANGAWGACVLASCNAGYHAENGACTSDTRTCAVANGTGTQSFTNGAWGTCALVACNAGYHVENGACTSNTRTCAVTNGTGTETWTGSAWSGTCVLASCNTGYHAESGACFSNTRSCTFTNGTGTQTWTGSAWGTCTVASCDAGYHIESSACVSNQRTCTVANGGGTQSWTGSAWGPCNALSCNGLADGSPCDDSDACTTGETCVSGACVGPSAQTYAVLEAPAMTFAASAWTSPTWNNVRMASGIATSGRSIYFGSTGVYRVTLSYRHGNGGDVWTAVRLYGNGTTRGTSAGYGNTGTYNPDLFTVTFLATVDNAAVPYEVQLGRLTSTVVVDQPNTVVSETLPAVQATLQKIDDLGGTEPYAQLHGPSQSFAQFGWTPVSFTSAPLANRITQSGSNLTFTTPGVYRVTMSWRWGVGNDSWTSVRLAGLGTIGAVGQSAGFGNAGSNANLFTVSFLATVRDVSQAYQVQIGRREQTLTIDGTPSAIAGVTTPAVQATVQKVGELPGTGTPKRVYAQVEGDQNTFAANAWTPVTFARVPVSAGVQVNGSNLTFVRRGVYRVTLSYRFGSGSDVWTGVRLHDGVGTRGVSPGFGNFANTTNLFTTSFLARVTDTTRTHQIQVGRLASAQTVIESQSIFGGSPGGVQATIEEVKTFGCSDGNDCTADLCDQTTGCMNPTFADGSTCETGSLCTADTCQAGTCVTGAAEICDDGSSCTTDSCNPATGCRATALADNIACTDGSANTSPDTCQASVCTGTTVTPHAVFEAPALTFPGNAWTSPTWNSTRFSNGISASGQNITFTSTGIYRVNLSWRMGGGTDAWTAVRLYGNGQVKGVSAGFGNVASNDPHPNDITFLARVDSTAYTYQVQVGRLTYSLQVITPSEIVGTLPPALQATITKVDELVPGTARYAQLEGPMMTFASNAWTSAVWNNVPISNGVTVSGGNLTFNRTGVYRVTMTWRFGNGADSWTALRLFGGGRTVGTSAGFGNSGYQSHPFTASFLANVDDITVPYAIQMGRQTSSDIVDLNPAAIAGTTPPALQATVERVGDLGAASTKAYAQLEAGQQTWGANFWAPIYFSNTTFASGISATSRFITFPRPGLYRVSIGYRFGAGTDVWTALRLQGATTVGVTAGTGNISNTSNLFTMTFLARILDANRTYELQMGRLSDGNTVNATPSAISGVLTPAIQVSIDEL